MPNPANSYNHPIAGMAYIKTFYNVSTNSIPLRNKPIYIDTTLDSDTGSHFFSIPTNADGSFTLYVSDTTRSYRIFTICYDTSSPSFIPLYYGSILVSRPYNAKTNYALTATIDTLFNNGMIIYSVDKYRNIIPGDSNYESAKILVNATDSSTLEKQPAISEIPPPNSSCPIRPLNSPSL